MHTHLHVDTPIYVAGHRGLVGSAIWRHLQREGFTSLIGRPSVGLDLRDRDAVFDFVGQAQPRVVIDAAARVGGILANDTYPAEFISDNLRMQVNLMDAAAHYGVPRLLFLGSSCIYPKYAEQPIREESLMTGHLEATNDAYAVAKIAGIMQVQAIRRQFGLAYISAMPTNLYGPGDNFDLQTSHVLPAMIRRFHEARAGERSDVVLWGTGSPRREFLHVDDLARACVHLLEHYDEPEPINVGVGEDVTLKELAELVAAVVGYEGRSEWDCDKPDGTPRKLLDVSRIKESGWSAQIGLRDGIASTYEWYLHDVQTRAAAER